MLLRIKFAHYRRLAILLTFLFFTACTAINELDLSKYSLSSSDEINIKDTPEYHLVESVLVGEILPSHNQLDIDLNNLKDKAERFCLQTHSEDFKRLKQAWIDAMHSWSSVGVFNYGPIDDLNIAWKFQFWPDPLNYVHRKFKSRLSGKNLAITEEELAKSSVAIQGLSAIEYLIFDTKVGGFNAYHAASHKCKILMATASNLAKEGRSIAHAWNTSYKNTWLNPRVENSSQAPATHYLETILNGMLTNLSLLKDRKLGTPLGLKQNDQNQLTKTGKVNAKRLESWRSETSLMHIKSNLMAMEKLYFMPKGFSWYLAQKVKNTPVDQKQSEMIDAKIKELFIKIFEQIYSIQDSHKKSVEDLVKTHETKVLEALYSNVNALFDVLRFDYMNILGLHYRFNAHDGD